MIVITSFGEFLLYFIVIFLFYFHFIKKIKIKFFFAGMFLCAIFILQDYMSSGFEL